MFSSETLSSNHNTLNSAEVEFAASREFMDSDLFHNHNQPSSGLTRYRSAPSSFLAAILDSTTTDNGGDSSGGDDESEALFSALMNGSHRDLNQKNDSQMQFCMKQELGVEMGARPGQNGFANGRMGYCAGMESGVDMMRRRVNNNGNGSSNLLRQSSSPAGFFNVGEVGNYQVLHNHAEANPSASNLSNHINFSSTQSSSTRFMLTIPENRENDPLRNGNNSANGSWNESSLNALKRNRDGDLKMFSGFNEFENQNGDTGKHSHGLVHHLSLPKTSSEMAAVENYLEFQQDTKGVPCQIRAKRGFATHPRSIAERMRRIRISEKMKKLQDLFPNMEKQTNTSEMLDSVVEYIKDLQKEVKMLKDTKANCVCSSKPQQASSTT
ncbi:hypothetical protein BUALT_Bualt19G0037000 [Buddleja alternifolia]|uniref:BHLH domain-containing protein n=1 Tax=Buddleja alternifolia TaxID=168488 RepID=A0AAV6W962_9LAMI|nr:hypothetical protein BUALT_Bualt19G0037000 [Buddleja alternifolia]